MLNEPYKITGIVYTKGYKIKPIKLWTFLKIIIIFLELYNELEYTQFTFR